MYKGNRKKFAALAVLAGLMVGVRVSANSGDVSKEVVSGGSAEMVDGVVHKNIKIGYVDMSGLLERIPGVDKCELQLSEYAAVLDKNLKDRYESMVVEANQLQNAKDLTDAERQEKYRALMEKTGEFERLRDDNLSLMNQKKIEVFRPIFVQINKAVEEIAREGHYDFILSKSSSGSVPELSSDMVLYGKAEFDLTQSLLDRIKKNMQEKAPVVGPRPESGKKMIKGGKGKGKSLQNKGSRGK